MNTNTILLLSVCIIAILLSLLCFQRLLLQRQTDARLKEISRKLSDILSSGSGEQIMLFTDSKSLMELCGQINRLLLDRQKINTDYKRQEISSKRMLSNISHDIKTPLTVILGYLEIMRLDDSENKLLQKVETQARQVMELINQFFTLAKLEAGDTDIEISKININELCRENILGFYEILLQKDFTVDVSIPEQDIFVQGNPEALRRILTNLISNAIRYGSDGCYLGFALREDSKFVWIDIIDKGKGIGKAFAANVFERLYTLEDSRSRDIQGNGLGLTIARNLALRLGGDILLDSEPDKKTIFTVQLKKIP